MQNNFAQNGNLRSRPALLNRIRAGMFIPVCVEPVRPNAGGLLSQSVEFDIDPVVGRLNSTMYAEVISVFVPALALEEFKHPEIATSGYAEAFREKMMTGETIFDLEEEGLISKNAGVNPRSIAGVKMVSEITRLAYYRAINYIAKQKYIKAAQFDNVQTALSTALFSENALDRMGGVLDPDETANGSISIGGKAPVEGIGKFGVPTVSGSFPNADYSVRETGGSDQTQYAQSAAIYFGDSSGKYRFQVQEDPDNPGFPGIYANLSGADSDSFTLKHLWNAERSNELIKVMDDVVRNNPEHGEEIVNRFAHKLEVDYGRDPAVIFHEDVPVGKHLRRATDGASLNVEQTETGSVLSFSRLIPKSEFGGVVITIAALKPDEVLASQPDPELSIPWTGVNYLQEELNLDFDKVTVRDLYSDCDAADENEVMMHVGHNHMRRTFSDYGFTRNVNVETIQNKNKIWQLEIPLSVSAGVIFYPYDISHHPWPVTDVEVCTLITKSNFVISSALPMGPSPLEKNQAIYDLELLENE